MKFAIDVKAALSVRRSGIGNYIFNLVDHLIQLDEKNEYFLIAPNSNFISPFRLKSNFQIGSRYNLFNVLKVYDTTHGPDFKLPLVQAKRKIITIHDLASFADQDFMSERSKALTREKVLKVVKSGSAIITISNTMKNQLENDFPDTRGRIKTIYHGVNKNIRFVDDEAIRNSVKNKYKLPESFLLFVGNIEIRKNLVTLFKAIKQLKDEYKSTYKLVIVGKEGWGFETIKKFIVENNLVDDIQILGWVDDNDLYTIYSLAGLFIFPSFYEGFGLPVIEAMKCKLPVISSDTPISREIAEDAAIFFKTTNAEDLADKIFSISSDEHQKNVLIKKGIERAGFFDWNKTARETLKFYEN